jgi:hypothetical protein
MNPQVITQLRQELRKQGLNIESDVVGYAKSINLYKGRKRDGAPGATVDATASSSTGVPQVNRTTMELDSKKQQLIVLVKKATSTGPLATFQQKFIDKIQAISSLNKLKEVGGELVKLIEMAHKAQQAGPEASQAFGQATTMFMKQAEQKKPQQPGINLDQTVSKYTADANKGIISKADSLGLHTIYSNLRMYTPRSSNDPVNIKIPTTEDTDKAWVVGLPIQDGVELLALGFATKRSLAYLVADQGRPAQQLLGHLFQIVSGDSIATLRPALKKADGSVSLGKISLPL